MIYGHTTKPIKDQFLHEKKQFLLETERTFNIILLKEQEESCLYMHNL